MTTCKNCGAPAFADDNGRGVTIWCHEFGSTVCYDEPPGSMEDHDSLTVAEPLNTKDH